MMLPQMLKRTGRSEGFTLVELLIVIAIIAILSAIAIPQFTKYRLRNLKTEIDADARNAYTAAQAYLMDNSESTVDSLDKLKSGGYQRSSNIVFNSGTMDLDSGIIMMSSTAGGLVDNNAVVHFNGRIDFPNAP